MKHLVRYTPAFAATICGVLGAFHAINGVWLAAANQLYVMGVDTNVIATIQKQLQGRELYTDITLPPFDIAQYGPVFYFTCKWLANLLSVSPEDVHELTVLCRSISLAAGLAVTLLLFLLIRRSFRTDVCTAVLLSSIFYVSSVPWYYAARPDSLATLFGLMAFGSALESTHEVELVNSNTSWLVIFSYFSAFMATASKQSGVQWILALILFWSLFSKPRRLYLSIFCTLFGITVAVLSLFVFGEHAYENVVDGVRNPVSLRNAMFVTYHNYLTVWSMLPVAAFVSLVLAPSDQSEPRRHLLLISLGGTFLFAIVTGMKTGSMENYFIETTLVSVICISAANNMRVSKDASATASTVSLHFLICMWALVTVPVFSAKKFDTFFYSRIDSIKNPWFPSPNTTFTRFQDLREFVGEDDSNSGLILCFNKPLSLLYPNRAIFRQAEVAQLMYQKNQLSSVAFQELLKQRKIRFVLTDTKFVSWYFLGIDLGKSFEYMGQKSGVHIYECK